VHSPGMMRPGGENCSAVRYGEEDGFMRAVARIFRGRDPAWRLSA